jgi:hypothetical protein
MFQRTQHQGGEAYALRVPVSNGLVFFAQTLKFVRLETRVITRLGQPKELLINLRIMAHCAFDSRATVWTGS